MRPVFWVFMIVSILLVGIAIGNHNGMKKAALLLDFVPQIPRNETYLGMQTCKVYAVCGYKIRNPCTKWAGQCVPEYFCWPEYHECDKEYAVPCVGKCWFATSKDLTHTKESIEDTRPKANSPTAGYNDYNPYSGSGYNININYDIDPNIMNNIRRTMTATTIKPTTTTTENGSKSIFYWPTELFKSLFTKAEAG